MVQDAKGRAKPAQPTLAHFMPPGLSSIEVEKNNCTEIKQMIANMKSELKECNAKFEELRQRGPLRRSDGMPFGKDAEELCSRAGKLHQQLALFRGRAPTRFAAGVQRWRAARREVLQERGVLRTTGAFNEVLYEGAYDDIVTSEVSSEVSESMSVNEAVLKNDPFWGQSGEA